MIDTLSDKPYCSPQSLVRQLSEAHLWNSRTLQPVSEDVSNRQIRPLKIKQQKSKGLKSYGVDFPGGTVGRNSAAEAGDTGSIPGLGRFHICCGATKPVQRNYWGCVLQQLKPALQHKD